jgi:hypothetical protein
LALAFAISEDITVSRYLPTQTWTINACISKYQGIKARAIGRQVSDNELGVVISQIKENCQAQAQPQFNSAMFD